MATIKSMLSNKQIQLNQPSNYSEFKVFKKPKSYCSLKKYQGDIHMHKSKKFIKMSYLMQRNQQFNDSKRSKRIVDTTYDFKKLTEYPELFHNVQLRSNTTTPLKTQTLLTNITKSLSPQNLMEIDS